MSHRHYDESVHPKQFRDSTTDIGQEGNDIFRWLGETNFRNPSIVATQI